MGWFWDDARAGNIAPSQALSKPPPPTSSIPSGCPMHNPTSSASRSPQQKVDVLSDREDVVSSARSGTTPSMSQRSSPASTVAALNPLNWMPADLPQHRESAEQVIPLPIDRETSSIPRGGADVDSGNWVYPSPQQMYNAMLRKGYTDTPQDAVESMVAVHNFLNEGAWAEIIEWERRFSKGLLYGWRESQFGEEGSRTGAMILANQVRDENEPKLTRFMGRSDAQTPKATMMQVLGWMYPSKYGGPPPFDRHDWYVERKTQDGMPREVRYVIDYYSAPPEPTGEPVFYLDIRPALDRPDAFAERIIRSGRDLWWRASGGKARLKQKQDSAS